MQKPVLGVILVGGLMLAGCGGGSEGAAGGAEAGGAIEVAGVPASPGATGAAGAVGSESEATGSGVAANGDTGAPGASAGTLAGPAMAPGISYAGDNRPPTIAGTAPAVVSAGADYEFVPIAADPEGGALRFTATSLPAWAALDPASGRLHGQPRSSDGGVFGPIVITVSDGVSQASLPEFKIEVVPGQGKGLLKLSWQLPDRNADGSRVERPLGTRIYFGRGTQRYDGSVTVPGRGATRHVLTGLESGTWYVAMTSVDPDGLESDFSDERVAVVN